MMTRTQKINRLAEALTYYRENKPQNPLLQRKHIEHVALKFGFGFKLMLKAIHIMSGVDVTGRTK